MMICALLVTTIIARERPRPAAGALAVKQEKGVSATEAFELLRQSKHLQIIALVISFAAVGAAIIEQQLNMAAAAAKGATSTDSITVFLANVQLWTSLIGFIIQVWLTSKIHRYLGIGFALMILPVSLGTSGVDHAAQCGSVGAWPGPRARPVPPLHRRQDDAGDSLPAAAGGHQAEGEVLRGRDRRSRSEGAGRAAPAASWSSRGACI